MIYKKIRKRCQSLSKVRIAASMLFLLIITAVIVFAIDYGDDNAYITGDYEEYESTLYQYIEDYGYNPYADIGDAPSSEYYSSKTDYYDEYDYIGYAPGYIGIMPFGAGRRVDFHPNGGVTPDGHAYRLTGTNGTLGVLPNPPDFGGRAFMWWSLDPYGRDPLVTDYANRFSGSTPIPEGGLTVYAVWGFNVTFNGNGIFFPAANPNAPTNPNSYVYRRIPNTWSFDEAQNFGLPVTFPVNPERSGFTFWGWYNYRIPNENTTHPAPPPAVSMNRYSIITSAVEIAARWQLVTHLVMFDMNYDASWITQVPSLGAGSSSQPHRLYRWVLNRRSIVDSGLGGDASTGLGLPTGTSVDGAPWNQPNAIPLEWYRQNRQRPWIPNAPFGDPSHIPRLLPDNSRNPAFTTPYYPGSGLVNPGASGVVNPNAGTWMPRSAPNVAMPSNWMAVPGANGSNGQNRPRYSLEGWWTTPDGWIEGGPAPGNTDNRRFAPAGSASTHINNQAPPQAAINIMPQGFPTGQARLVNDGMYPPTGIVTEDMTVYAHWVYRVTFNINGGVHGNQGFSLEWSSNFSPHTSNVINYRDILPSLPQHERTINQNGRRIRYNAGTFDGQTFIAHQPIFAGMPPDTAPTRDAHIFNGWWDRPVAVIPADLAGYDYWMNSWPETQGANRITGDTIINGNITAYAHWRHNPPPNVYVNFHLNAPVANINIEGNHGYAYWPTHRPYQGHVSDRFFLTRTTVSGYNIDITAPSIPETNLRYHNGQLEAANVNYADRYSPMIRRRYGYGNAISATVHPVNQRWPRNPRRAGYVFVGWAEDPNLPVFQANGQPTPIGSAIWDSVNQINNFNNTDRVFHISTPLSTVQAGVLPNGTLNLYAVWAPAFDLILAGNGNDLPAGVTEIVRTMAIGFTTTEMNNVRWGQWDTATGTVWFQGMYSVSGSPGWRVFYTRNGYTQIGPSYSFNTDQQARFDYGSQITSSTRFNQAFFDLFPANELQPMANGNDYLRIYTQWGGELAFNTNHSSINSGFANDTRFVRIADGHSVNSTRLLETRHAHLRSVDDIWSTWGGTGVTGNWAGTGGLTGNRGGWPRDPAAEFPPRATNVSGGDWIQLFNIPRDAGYSLLGWHRNSDGVCTPGMTWVTADTPIEGNTTIFAIWGPYLIFDPGVGGDAVDMAPVGAVHRPVIIGQPLPAPWPVPNSQYAPTWGARTFVNWFPVPIPNINNMPASLNTNNVLMARRYYAVFSAPVHFHPSGPGGLAAGGYIPALSPAPVGTPLIRSHILGSFINIIPAQNELPQRPGWPNSAFSGNWFALDSDEPNGRRIYSPNGPRQVMDETHLFGEWLSTVTFRAGHTRGRLDGLATNANVVRQVPEGLSLSTNLATQRVPAAISATGAAWPNDPGLYFAGWRRVDINNQPLNPDGTAVASGAPLPALWTEDQINNMVASGPSYYFIAIWGLRLEFYKVGATASTENSLGGLNRLPGARFVLEREIPASGGGTEWVRAYPPLPQEYVESDINGMVFIGETFNERLELLPTVNTVFRLREIQAPAGYRTPPGHWLVTASQQVGVTPVFAAYDHNPSFLTPVIGANDTPYEGHIWQLVGNTPYEFDFWKTDHTGARLSGAQFRLFVYNGDGMPNIPAPGLLTADMIGSGANQWTEIGTVRTSSTTDAMVFRMRPGRYYQLLETVPPAGFQLPLGQWRITVNTAAMPAYPTLSVTEVGGVPMPSITPRAGYDETYNILNWRDFVLPLTGGRGTQMFILSGVSVLFIALVGAGIIILRKSTRKIENIA
ncbi:MAG: SpaA isopeptide-forming pilin-related protein [Defluviitaleaceae bacterium]|nr:SpaA isopeptide-forming pilin-related protein [Defluviitaleaceae bacterium]